MSLKHGKYSTPVWMPEPEPTLADQLAEVAFEADNSADCAIAEAQRATDNAKGLIGSKAHLAREAAKQAAIAARATRSARTLDEAKQHAATAAWFASCATIAARLNIEAQVKKTTDRMTQLWIMGKE